MAERRRMLRRRRWADVVVIVVGVFELINGLYGGVLARDGAVAFGLRAPGWYYIAMVGAGTLALAAVLVAVRHTMLARVLCAAAGLVLLSGLAAFVTVDLATVLTKIVPGLLLLAATPFIGPMPAPEQEGKAR